MEKKLLDTIQTTEDLKNLSEEQLAQITHELRQFIIDVVSVKEGHLGASLGVVELTVALHYVFDTPYDKLIWDVGHQAYGHKILTGRRNLFHTNRQKGGISGFPNREESVFDAFGTGHSSTSISAALGMAMASQLKGDFDKVHIAVIGDASIASGMAFEGLNHAGVTQANLMIILNDNAIGIDPSVGALKNYLTKVKKQKSKQHNNILTALSIDYSGPIDGHNLPLLISELKRLKSQKGPRFLHIITTKGKGLKQAEENQVTYHAPGKFDKLTGEINPLSTHLTPPKFQDVFGLTLLELAEHNKSIIGITPAMPTGSSLKYMMDKFPDRAFDVGIAEQHAVTLAAGMATEGMIVYCTIYSTFLQRAYDQIIHDVALQNLPVIFCVDRAGLVGQDGATHHGVFDIAFLRCIPNMMVYSALDEVGLRNMLYTAQLGLTNPIAIRYPRGRGVILDWQKPFQKIEIGKAQQLKSGNKYAILSHGFIGNSVIKAIELLENSDDIAHYDFSFVKPLDTETLQFILKKFQAIITVEEGVLSGGFGSAVADFLSEKNYQGVIKRLGISDQFVSHGTVDELLDIHWLSVEKIKNTLQELLN